MTRPLTAVVAVLLVFSMGTANAMTKLERRLEIATDVIQKFTRIPEQGIPPSLLRNAHAVAVIPGSIKAGFMIGGRFGQGVLVTRLPDGRWSNPSFIGLGGGSFGLQIGVQSTDIVLVFKTRKSVEKIHNGRFTLGGDVAVAVGPWGRYTSASTDARLRSEIFSYSRSRGVFGGLSVDGAVLSMDRKANYAFYGTGDGTPKNILADDSIPTPQTARRFQEVLAAVAPPLQWQPADSRTADMGTTAPTDSGATTFAIDEGPAPEPNSIY